MLQSCLRYLLIVIVYALSCCIAGFGAIGLQNLITPPVFAFMPWFVFGYFAVLIIALYAALPTLALIAFAEFKSLRTPWLYVLFGLGAGVLLSLILQPNPLTMAIGAGLGLLVGGMFWFLVGRHAGYLKENGKPAVLNALLALSAFAAVLVFFRNS